MFRGSLPIRVHLAIFGALVALPLIAAALIAAALYVGGERTVLQSQAEQRAADGAAAVDRELDRIKLALQSLASSSALGDSKIEYFYLRAQALSESIPNTFIALRRPDGETVFVTDELFGEPSPAMRDAGLRAADRLVVQHRSPVITDVVTDASRGNFVGLQVPILANEKVEYLLLLGMMPKRIAEILAARPGVSGWPLVLLDNGGRIVGRSADNALFTGDEPSEVFAQASQAPSGTFIGTAADGVSTFNAYRHSELSGWKVAAAIPVAELQARSYGAMLLPAVLAVSALLGSLLLALLYARLLTRPLRQLQAAADARSEEKGVASGIAELDGVTGALLRSLVVLKDRDRARNRATAALNERMKYMVAIIQAIAEQTRLRATSLEQFGRSFNARLAGLVRSHAALGDPEWHSGNLERLIAETCRPFGDDTRIALRGPTLELPRKTAIGFGMAIHELASNAAKYGALSNPEGTVRVHWDLPQEGGLKILRLQWEERGGPSIRAIHREGFGTVMLHAIVESDFGGKLDMIFSRDGLHCIVCIPLNSLMVPTIVPHDNENEAAAARR